MPDNAGRQDEAERRWREIVADWSRSGRDITSYCAERGISRWSFYRWRVRLESAAADAGAQFLPVRVVERSEKDGTLAQAGQAGSAGLEVVLGGGLRLRLERGFDPASLVRAVRALEGSAC